MKFAKKSLSMVLSVLLIFSVFTAYPFTTASAVVNEICPWPGVPMNSVNGNIYAFDVPEEYNLLIFCDGQIHYEGEEKAYQTSDLSFPGGNMLYTASNGSIGVNKFGVKICGGSWSAYNAENSAYSSHNRRVYFKSPWGAANCYCWNYGGSEDTMTKLDPVDSSPYVPIEPEQQPDDDKPDFKFSLDSGINFTVPSDIPGIGGNEISIDLGSVPLNVDVDNHTARVTIGEEDDEDDDDEFDNKAWNEWKKDIQESKNNTYRDDKQRQKSRRSSKKKNAYACIGMGASADANITGYFEVNYDDQWNVIAAGGRLSGEISGSAEAESQIIAFSIPIVLKFNGEVGVSVDTGLKLDSDKSVIFIDNIEVVLPDIRVSAGIGIAHVADVSVYGALNNTVSLDLETLSATLSGEAGISAKVLAFEYAYPIFQGEKTYYNSNAKHTPIGVSSNKPEDYVNSANYVINRSYLKTQSDWLYSNANTKPDKKSIATVGANSSNYTTLQSSVYNGAVPHLVKTDDVTMMVWSADIPSRTTGNHIVVVFSIYNEYTDTWSEPAIIDNDGTTDVYPKVATDGSNIYVAWTNSKKVFDEKVSLEEMSRSSEIEIAKYNKSNNLFDCVTLTNNDVPDILGGIAVKDGNAYVVWSSNSENDIFQRSGINSVHYAVSDKNLNFKTALYAETSDIIFDLSIGEVNEKIAIAYNASPLNADPNNKAVIFAGYTDEKPHMLVDGVSALSNIQFCSIFGEPMITWAYDQRIFGSSDITNIKTLTDDDIYISADYQFASDGTNTILISNEVLDNRSEIFGYSYVDGRWTNPVVITDNGKYMRGVSAVNVGGKLQLAYLLTETSINGNDVFESSNLCVQSIQNNHNLSIQNISYDSNAIIPGGELPVSLQIDNDGSFDESAVNITVAYENGVPIMNQNVKTNLKSGESTQLTVNVPLPSKITGPTDYTVTVMSPTGYEVDSSDNSENITFGMTDLTLLVEEVFSKDVRQHGLLVTVISNNCVDTSAALYIRNSNEFSESIEIYNLGEIKGNSEVTYFIDADAVNNLLKYASTFSFELLSSKTENSVVDNKEIIFLGDFNNHLPPELPSTEPQETNPTTYPVPGGSKFIVAGSAALCTSDWDCTDVSNIMTKDGNIYTKTYKNVSPLDNISIKVAEIKNDGSVLWHGDKNGSNITFSIISTCDVTVNFYSNTNELTVSGSGIKYNNESAYDVDAMYVAGNGSDNWLNGESWNPYAPKNRMTKIENGIYRITYENVPSGSYQFKFVANGDWNLNWGGDFKANGEMSSAEFFGNNIYFTTGYDSAAVTMTIDIRNFNIYSGQGAQFSVLVEEMREEPPVILGDVNLDGEVTVDDATGIQRYIAQLVDMDEALMYLADTDRDGYITVLDATMIQKYIVGLIDSL